MTHDEASSTLAIEGYLLGDMMEEQRIEFEEHVMTCNECFSELKLSLGFTEVLRELIKERGKEVQD